MKDLKRKFNGLFKPAWTKFWPVLIILFVSIIFFYPVWVKKYIPLPLDALVGAHLPWIEIKWDGYPAGVPIKNQEITDAISQFYPWKSLVGKFWRSGEFPLWNRHMLSGMPFLATLHSAGLYPLNFVYLFLSDSTAWTMFIFLQIFLSGFFMYLFLRELGIHKYAAIFGGLVFSFSGYMIAWLEFATGGQAGLWLPLLLLFEFRLVKKENIKYIFPISLTFFLIFTAGDFQVPFYITVIYLLFGIYLTDIRRFNRKKFLNFINVIIGFASGILISLPQLLPTLELYMNSIRQDDPYISAYYFGLMEWKKVVNFIWPDFFGNVVTRNYWANYGYHEYLAFTGVVSIGFLIFSLISKKQFVEKFFWLTLVVSLIFLFPTPLAFLPYKLKIPGIGTSSASRILFLIDFSIAIIASYGFSTWIKNKNIKLKKVFFYLIVVSLGVALGLFISIFIMEKNALSGQIEILPHLKVSLRNMVPSSGVLILLFAVLFASEKNFLKKFRISKDFIFLIIIFIATAELLRFAWKNTPFSEKRFLFPSTETIDFLKDQEEPFRISGPGIPMNYYMQYGISSSEGYDSIYPAENAEWFSLVNFGDVDHKARRYGEISVFTSPLIDFANIKYVIDYQKNPRTRIPSSYGSFSGGLVSDRFKEVSSEGRVKIFENLGVLPKVWLTSEYEIADDKSSLVEKVNDLDFSQKKVVLMDEIVLEGDVHNLNYEIRNFNQDLNKIVFETKSSSNSLLFLSETYDPGWKAFVDGEETKIFRGNYIFQVIILPLGNHNVEFIYSPKSFNIGKWISFGTIVILFLVYLAKSKIGDDE